MDIKEALAQLDALDDAQWTESGDPAVAAVSELVGKTVSRAEIIEAAPKFNRSNMELDQPSTDPETETVTISEEKVLDISLLNKLSESVPMLPEELVENYLKRMDPQLLPQAEIILINQIAAIEKQRSDLEEKNRKLKLSLATTRSWIKTLVPDISNQEAIALYIKSSQEHRAAKNAKISDLLGGLKAADIQRLDPRAPIDKAFARKTGRGTQRPKG